MERMRGDEGRFPIGALITVLVIAAAGYGAYWFLGEQGFLGEASDEPTVAAEAAGEGEEDLRPEWLQGTDHQLPAVIPPEDDRMPSYYQLQPWVWDLVDDDWNVTVVRVGEGDQYTWFSDVQELYLVSPTDELFRIAEFDTTINRDVVHWDPELEVAWIVRADGAQYEQVIEFDLRQLQNDYTFTGGAISTANRIENGVANLGFVGDQPDGLELWISWDANGDATGVLWRDGEEWIDSLVQDEITRMVREGFSQDRGVDAWVDAATGRAVYHGVYVDPRLGTVADQRWITHDLQVDSFDDSAVVPTPSDDCVPAGGTYAGAFDGDRIIADCGGTEWLLDPYGLSEPTQR